MNYYKTLWRFCHGNIGPGKIGPAGPILDTKTGLDRPNLVDQDWSGLTKIGPAQTWLATCTP